jgi:hypothetical protein
MADFRQTTNDIWTDIAIVKREGVRVVLTDKREKRQSGGTQCGECSFHIYL